MLYLWNIIIKCRITCKAFLAEIEEVLRDAQRKAQIRKGYHFLAKRGEEGKRRRGKEEEGIGDLGREWGKESRLPVTPRDFYTCVYQHSRIFIGRNRYCWHNDMSWHSFVSQVWFIKLTESLDMSVNLLNHWCENRNSLALKLAWQTIPCFFLTALDFDSQIYQQAPLFPLSLPSPSPCPEAAMQQFLHSQSNTTYFNWALTGF